MVVLWRVAAGLLLPLIPTLAVFGNALVIIAVYRERSLQTVTNMLIVSLAVSDFMAFMWYLDENVHSAAMEKGTLDGIMAQHVVAICVMSFGVYYEYFQWNGFKWEIGQFFCNVYLASDVACSTASILNLLAISLDRYIAISHPISYAQYGARGGRAMVSIAIVWGVSLVVGLPILFGINPMENDISSALLGGARIARQMGKHFKNRTDQILLEISFQVILH
uniref:G_PROTEIN_RECEP_F1_2 domain-containing protein n=1 Tax=Heterorhabditis bacteriophora TaxID=37862 RepID=A0A1I7XQZ7_HETBA